MGAEAGAETNKSMQELGRSGASLLDLAGQLGEETSYPELGQLGWVHPRKERRERLCCSAPGGGQLFPWAFPVQQ